MKYSSSRTFTLPLSSLAVSKPSRLLPRQTRVGKRESNTPTAEAAGEDTRPGPCCAMLSLSRPLSRFALCAGEGTNGGTRLVQPALGTPIRPNVAYALGPACVRAAGSEQQEITTMHYGGTREGPDLASGSDRSASEVRAGRGYSHRGVCTQSNTHAAVWR